MDATTVPIRTTGRLYAASPLYDQFSSLDLRIPPPDKNHPLMRPHSNVLFFVHACVPGFCVALQESGLLQRPHFYIRQHVDEAEIPKPYERLSANLELHRLDR